MLLFCKIARTITADLMGLNHLEHSVMLALSCYLFVQKDRQFCEFQSISKLNFPLQTVPITVVSDWAASLKQHCCINPLPSKPATCRGLAYSWLHHNMAAWWAAHTKTSIRERLPCNCCWLVVFLAAEEAAEWKYGSQNLPTIQHHPDLPSPTL